MANKVRLAVGFIDLDVVVTTAVDSADEDTTLSTVCVGAVQAHDPVRIKQSVACPSCSHTSSSHWGFPHKARTNDDGTMTVLSAEELAGTAAGPELTHRIELTSHPVGEVLRRTLPSGKFYYLAPGKDAGQAGKYDGIARLIGEAEEKGRAFCTMFAVRSKPAMYRLGVIEGCITIAELARPEQLKARPAIDLPSISEADMDLLRGLAERTFGEFDPARFVDQRRERIAAALTAKTPTAAGLESAGSLASVTAISPFALAAAAQAAADGPAPAAKAKRAPRKRPVKAAADADLVSVG